jgi:hypothetical protein
MKKNQKKLPFRLGVSLYSFNIDYYTYKKTLEDCMAAVGSLGSGMGLEIVFQQMDKNYPDLSPEFECRVKNAFDKYELVPSCFSGYPDPGLFRNDDDQLDYLVRQIRAGKQLGFKLVRILPRWRTIMVEKLLTYAEKYDVVLLAEVHCPWTMETISPFIEFLDKLNSPYFGIFPDCGTMCRAPSEVYVKRFRDQGVPQNAIDLIQEMWHKKATEAEIGKAVSKIASGGIIDLAVRESMEYFGHGEPKALLPIMKHIKHVHGKFFYVNDDGEENAVRIPEITTVLLKGGYSGFISSEYEGHHWFAEYDALEQIRRHHALIRRSCFEAQ